MLKKALVYLGLGPDEEYEQYDDFTPVDADDGRPAVRVVAEPTRPTTSTARPVPAATPKRGSSSTVRVVPAEPSSVPARAAAGTTSRTAAAPDGASVIRIVDGPPTKPHAVTPTSFNEAQGIGDRFKAGQPVIVNLQGVERDLRRRLVDFSSGLCYALGGKMDRVADQVYLLTPTDMDVSSDDTRRALD